MQNHLVTREWDEADPLLRQFLGSALGRRRNNGYINQVSNMVFETDMFVYLITPAILYWQDFKRRQNDGYTNTWTFGYLLTKIDIN